MGRYSVHKNGSALRRVVLTGTLIVLTVVIVGVALVRQRYVENIKPVSDSSVSQLVTVETGTSAKQIAAQLKKAELIRDATVFEWYVRNHDARDKLQAGSYYIRPSMTVPEIVGILTQGKVATDLLTILPGKRIDQIEKTFINAGYSKAEVDAAFNPDLYKDSPALSDKPAGASLEGYLAPESYQMNKNTKPEEIVRDALEQTQKNLTPAIRAAFVKRGLTVHQGVILASVVEREVSKESDKPTVAQVFLKRYAEGMQLGSDVTAFYGAIINGQEPTVGYDTPYNTRIHTGLPAGPISNVTASSLKAVAFPSNTDYVYFVAGDDGTTYFAHTLAEHDANVKAYCHKLCGN